jgi:branched-chain amino acid transport system permease protein
VCGFVLLDGLDELLQASQHDRSSYLQQIAEFQRLEAEQERPEVVIVTSRTVVADRVSIPSHTTIVKLDPFSDEDIATWLHRWHLFNATAIAAGKVRKLALNAARSLFSLGQAAVLAIGAWAAARLLFATTKPYPLVLLEAGLITMVAGLLIGLPALRLRGLYLALITLMLAGGISVVLATVNSPNGGHGFLGYNGGLLHIPPIRRPSIAASDPAYFRYSMVVAILMFALVLAHIKTRPGRAWAAIRQSEPAALAAGINIWFYKLWAFALASFITGVAGGVLAGAIHYLYSINFPTQDSITLLAVTLMGGVFSLWGAVIAGFLSEFLPALLNNWGVSADWLIILFGLGVLQVLTTAPAGLADQVPRDLARLRHLLGRRLRRVHPGR